MTATTAPQAESSPSAESSALLGRGLGAGSIVFMVVAAAAPLAVVAANIPIILAVAGSPAAPVYFTTATVILVLFAVGFTAMTRFVPNAGAFYSYIQAGLGRVTGTGAAMVALVSYILLFVAVNAYVGAAASSVIARFSGWESPWWVWALLSFAAVGVLGYRDIELSSKVLGILLVAETLAIVILDVVIVGRGGAHGLSTAPLSPSAAMTGTPSLGLMFAFFCFIGFEATAVFRNEARDPDRTIPRATYIAVISIGVFYAVSSWAVVVGTGTAGAVAAATKDPENLVFDLATRYASSILQDVMQVLLVTSFFACVLSFHNVITRYLFTLGSKRVLPKRLALVNARHKAPSAASLTVSIVTGLLMIVAVVSGLDPVAQTYTWLSGLATLGVVILMALTSIAVIVYFRRRRDTGLGAWHTTIAPALAFLGLASVTALVVVNFPLLVGSMTAAIVASSVLVATFVIGAAVAVRIRRRRPADYAALIER